MQRKQLILLLCIAVIVAVVLLASTMHDVRFEPAKSFSVAQQPRAPIPLPDLHQYNNTPLWKILLFWSAFVVNLVVFFFLLPPEVRKRILRQAISFALGILMLLIAVRYNLINIPELLAPTAGAPASGAPAPGSVPAAPDFQQPQVSPWIAVIVGTAFVWLVIVLLWLAYRRWQRPRPRGTLHAIANIARSSLDDLAAGREWTDVVIEAYSRMNDAVETWRGIRRGAAVTPREFEDRLARAGLPHSSVAGLTRLFESARYSVVHSSEDEGRRAVACLESILRACGAPS